MIEIAERQSETMELQQKKISTLQAQLETVKTDDMHGTYVDALRVKDTLLEEERARADQLSKHVAIQGEKIESLLKDLASANSKVAKLETELKSARDIHASMASQLQGTSGLFRGVLAVSPSKAIHDISESNVYNREDQAKSERPERAR